MPFVGVLLGVVVLDERVGWNVALGGAVVIAGIVTVRRRVVAAEPLEVGSVLNVLWPCAVRNGSVTQVVDS